MQLHCATIDALGQLCLWKLFRNQMVPSCAEWWGEMDNRATTPFSYCPSTTFLPHRPHCTNGRWNRCQEALNDNDCIVMLYSCTHMATVSIKELTRLLPVAGLEVVSFQVATWRFMVVLKLLPAPYFPSIYIPPSCYVQTLKKCAVFESNLKLESKLNSICQTLTQIIESLYTWAQLTTMTTENFLVDNCCDGQTVETVRECLPESNIKPPFTWI